MQKQNEAKTFIMLRLRADFILNLWIHPRNEALQIRLNLPQGFRKKCVHINRFAIDLLIH